MKIIHTSDLHLGQIIYRHYDRDDEHDLFFSQLMEWCEEERPDALVVTGDIFDIQQPSAAAWRRFTDYFVALRHRVPGMSVIMIAGNHDSPSRLHSHKAVWREIGTVIVAIPPTFSAESRREDWEEDYIIELESGFIVAIPYMTAQRADIIQLLLDRVAERNTGNKPVVMTGHLAVTGCDVTGHDMEIGKLRTVELGELGSGYDYLALGHIHRPQTLGKPQPTAGRAVSDTVEFERMAYDAPVARYAGSVLHISCDERYPHTVSVVTIDRHGGTVEISTRRIRQLRHFHILSMTDDAPFATAEDALDSLGRFAKSGGEGYFRFRLAAKTMLPSDFNQRVYDIIEPTEGRLRYNPKIDWVGTDEKESSYDDAPTFEVVELQQMTDPMLFIEKTIDQYPGLDLDSLREAFHQIEDEIRRMNEESQKL